MTAELHPVLISVNPIASREQLDTLQHLFLSNLRVPKIELVPDAVLTLVASGHDTGIFPPNFLPLSLFTEPRTFWRFRVAVS